MAKNENLSQNIGLFRVENPTELEEKFERGDCRVAQETSCLRLEAAKRTL